MRSIRLEQRVPRSSASGTCTVTVVQPAPEPGTGTLTVTGLTDPIVSIGGVPTTITEPISTDLDLSAASAEKTWFLVDVTITPGADNLAGDPHTFTVQVTGFDGDGPFPDGEGVPGAVVSASCVVRRRCRTDRRHVRERNQRRRQCTLIVTNTGSGSIVVQLDQVTATIDGNAFVIALTAGAPGLSPDTVLPIQSDKTWWQYRVILSDSSINPLGDVTHLYGDGGADERRWHDVAPGARRHVPRRMIGQIRTA